MFRLKIQVRHILLPIFGYVCIFLGCVEKIPGGEVTVRNDIQDREYNVLIVDQISSTNGGSSYQKSLKPGEQSVLPFKGITSIRFSRRYRNHTNVYIVNCPQKFDRRVTMKLIDVHLNKLSGGCYLSKKGRTESGFTSWE
jgi:hypothetical protein